jgi:hypothetical protein
MVATCASALVAVGLAVACLVHALDWYYAIAGYILGCIAAVATASVHRALENKQRANPQFRLEPWIARVTTGAMVLGIIGGLASAYVIAHELAKQR